MLNWLLRRKRGATPTAVQAPEPSPAPKAAPAAPEDWGHRLEAARGDDAALLAAATTARLLEHKLAAVEALAGEDALRQAEREFRRHDRRVHQRVRQRLAAAVARRESRVRADELIAAAQALLAAPPIAVNRLAAIERDWRALDAALLDAGQGEAYAALRAQLDAALAAEHERRRAAEDGARQQAALAEPRPAPEASPACEAAGERQAVGALDAAAQEATEGALEAPADTVAEAAPVAASAAASEAGDATEPAPEPLPQHGAAPEPATSGAAVVGNAPVGTSSAGTSSAGTSSAGTSSAETASGGTAPVGTASAGTPPTRAPRPDLLPAVEALLGQAEAALAEGGSREFDRLLQALDAALAEAGPRDLPARARRRLQALRAERQRLKGWQRWGGALARQGLIAEAEALARAAAQGDSAALDARSHGDAIRDLRARWKALDRSDAVAGQGHWKRFDGALTQAYVPLAAQREAHKAAREANLAAREALLAALEGAETPTPAAALQALKDFRAGWHKLGPIAHTVPAASAAALAARAEAATSRVEAPLAEARAAAGREREALVERAEALARSPQRDAWAQLRRLQAEWQEHARALPLARDAEAALWARFRQACDAVAAERDATQQAREAEAEAGIAAREALLQRLDALAHGETPDPGESSRALAQIDREWRALYTPLPRPAAQQIEARYAAARDALLQAGVSRRRERWRSHCDALASKLEAIEPAEPCAAADDAAEELLLALEDALAIAPDEAQAQARRDLKLRALKDALEGRTQAPDEPRRNAGALAALLARPVLDAAQRARLGAVIAAMREAQHKFDAALDP